MPELIHPLVVFQLQVNLSLCEAPRLLLVSQHRTVTILSDRFIKAVQVMTS